MQCNDGERNDCFFFCWFLVFGFLVIETLRLSLSSYGAGVPVRLGLRRTFGDQCEVRVKLTGAPHGN